MVKRHAPDIILAKPFQRYIIDINALAPFGDVYKWN